MSKPTNYKCSIVPKEVFDEATITEYSTISHSDAIRGKPYIVLLDAEYPEQCVIDSFKAMANHASGVYEQGHWAEWEIVGMNALFIRVRN